MEENIFRLVDTVQNQMEDFHFSKRTIKQYQHSSFKPILDAYTQKGISIYNQAIMTELLEKYNLQYRHKEISYSTYTQRKRGVLLLQDAYYSKEIRWKIYYNFCKAEVPEEFKAIYESYLSSLNQLSESTVSKLGVTARNFFICLTENHIIRIEEITSTAIEIFLRQEHERTPENMESVIYGLRKLFLFLEKQGLDIHKLWIFLKMPLLPERVKPTFTEEEILQIINVVDTTKAPGKRNLAILSLAVTTGLRASDIVSLKLEHISWKEKEIRIIQKKTGEPVVLPLKPIVVDILADYKLNERPDSSHSELFLSCRAPFRPFSCGSSISEIVKKYMKIAKIPYKHGDGKTFHGLRRYLGTKIISSGSPATTVAQVLGHRGISATKQYIAIDTEGLKKCILSMSTLGGAK